MARYIDADVLLNNTDGLEHVKYSQEYGHVVSVCDIVYAPTIDAVEVVRCKDCKHRPTGTGANHDLEFPDDECPCQCAGDYWYSWMPPDDWFCPCGEKKENVDE